MIKVLEVDPIWADNVTILKKDELDKVVELPLLEACKLLYQKNIKSVMSSCNKYNVIGLEHYIEGYEEGIGQRMLDSYRYGEGYAWIMLDYDSLDIDNKKICEILNDQNDELCLYSVEESFKYYGADEEFKKRCKKISQSEPHYGYRTVILRYPVNEETTIEEVNNYFVEIVSKFNNQEKAIKTDNELRCRLFELANRYKKELEDNDIYITEDMFMQSSFKSYDSPMQERYGIDDCSAILVHLLVLATLDLNNLLKDPNLLMVYRSDKDYIHFLYNGEDYIISGRTINDKGVTLRFGDYTKGEEQIEKEDELLSLYNEFDYNRELYYHQRDIKETKAHFPGRI